jgi:hypothetical protein
MDTQRHVLICFVISTLMDREKEWKSYEMEAA